MTLEELNEGYHVPADMIRKYERWGFGRRQSDEKKEVFYDDVDLKRLSIMMTLQEMGFIDEEIKKYMQLLLKGESTRNERLQILNRKRKGTLDEIHLKEKQLEHLDYFRFKLNDTEGEKI